MIFLNYLNENNLAINWINFYCIIHSFLAIWWPLKLQITKRRARIMIICIWIIAIINNIPCALFFDLIKIVPDLPELKICAEVWPPGTNGNLYFLIAHLVFCYILPFVVISLCYILIWIKVSPCE